MNRPRLTYADRVGAGASADARYRTLLRAWRARTRLAVLLAMLPILGVMLLCALLVPAFSQLYLGMGLGAIAALYMALTLSAPEYIDRLRRGSEGEKQTAAALKPLAKQGWTVVHDRAARYGNSDHIVVGSSGVYLLDSKVPGGIVEVQDDVMTIRRREDPADSYDDESPAHNLPGAAAGLGEELGRTTRYRPWVQPVVVIWSEFEQQVVEDKKLAWVHGKRLRAWLAAKPDKLAEDRRARLEEAVNALPLAPVWDASLGRSGIRRDPALKDGLQPRQPGVSERPR
jgi:hypothetical protein